MIRGINDDRAIRYEGAAEILNAMIAATVEMAAAEEAQSSPDTRKLEELDAKRSRLAFERRILDADDLPNIERIYSDYAPLIKTRVSQSKAA